MTIVFGPLAVLFTYGSFDMPGRGFWQPAAVFWGIYAWSLLWLRYFEITIGDGELRFRALFSGTRTIRDQDIEKIRLAWEIGNGLQGPLRLIVEPVRGRGLKRFSINAKVFSGRAVAAVLAHGKRVATSDDGGLKDGIVMKVLRERRAAKSRRPSRKAP